MKNKKPLHWSRLDNAAKIFPPTSSSRDTKVFRFACELYEEIDPEILQLALNHTLEVFPFYRSVLKKGMFWYYFETSRKIPKISEEATPLCSQIYNGDKKDLLFRVTYYKKRINLEVYHALSDGTGALHFLKTLVSYYIFEKYQEELHTKEAIIDYDASAMQKNDDSFLKYYSKEKKRGQTQKNQIAYHVHGERFSENRIGVIEGLLSSKALMEKAHEYHVTVTVLLASILICSIKNGMSVREQEKPVVITLPVNLRNFFPSESARNFFGVINVPYLFHNQSDALEDVIRSVHQSFTKQLNTEHLQDNMNRLSRLEHNMAAKIVPLFFKNICLKTANFLSEREITAAFSNIGKITMPEEIASYIRLFDVFVSTKKIQTCVCSYQDHFMISFTSPFLNTDIQKNFFRTLVKMGLEVTITAGLPEMD